MVAISLLPVFFTPGAEMRRVRNAAYIAGAVTLGAGLVAAVGVGDLLGRYGQAVQLTLNAYVFVVVLSLCSRLSFVALRRTIVLAVVLMTMAVLVQVLLWPQLNPWRTETWGIPRPILAFVEEGWLGLFAALLAVACTAARAYVATATCLLIVLLSDNRGALLVAFTGIAMCIAFIARDVLLRLLVLAVPLVIAVAFLSSALLGVDSFVSGDQTLNTRADDIRAVLSANGTLVPFGGQSLDVFDVARARQLPDVSNVWLFDLVWKFGLFGLAIFVAWAWFFLVGAPRALGLALGTHELRIGSAVAFTALCVMQFNNAAGRVWLWVLIAVTYAVLASRGVSAARASEENARS